MAEMRRVVKILMLGSTVPADADDRVPRFVLDQALHMATRDPSLEVLLLAPHTPSSHRHRWPRDESEDGRVRQSRFRYAPRRWERLTENGIMPAITRNRLNVLLLPLLMVAEYRAVLRAARRERPDVIYAHWFTPQAVVARRVSRRLGIPYGYTTHASDVAVWGRFGAWGRRIVARGTRDAAFITAVSHQTAQKLFALLRGEDLAVASERVRIIPMGVDLPDRPAPAGDPLHVAIAARLVEKKGVHVLLEAWPEVLRRVPGARLTVAGDGPWRERLMEQARQAGLDVRFPGFIVGEAKEALLENAGVIVQPSVVAADGDADGLPVALMEALALGRIGVASDASGAQDLISDGKDGFLVPTGDPQALAEALVRALTLSATVRASMSAAARETARRVAWPRVADVHLSVISP